MDTQIRPVTPEAAIMPVPAASRTTLSQPQRSAAIEPTSTGPAVLLAQLRHAILRCADEAARAEPNDTDARLHCFMAKLSGTMESLGQHDLDIALWDLLRTSYMPVELMPWTTVRMVDQAENDSGAPL
jgi:hypothetical protein